MSTTLENVFIVGIRRLNNSVNGNPRFDVSFSDGTIATTQSDASIVYDVENKLRSGARLNVTLTKSGRIATWSVVSES